MRTWILLASLVLLGSGLTERTHAQSAREIITKAIEAHGGEANLKKFQGAKVKTKGKLQLFGMELAVTGETTYQLPNLGKNVMKLEVANRKVEIVQIFNDGKIRMTSDGNVAPLSDSQKSELKESIRLQAMHQLLPLLGEEYELSVIENAAKVNDKEVVGVLVKSKGGRDAKLFFDKKTHVLLKISRTSLDPTDKEVPQDMIFLEHRKFDGILRPVKSEVFMDGKKFMEMEAVEFKHLENVDKKEFDISD